MENVIIYGGAGFIGRVLAENLLRKGINVCIVEKEGTYDGWRREKNELSSVDYIECNLADVQNLYKKIKDIEYDTFFQLAWDGLDAASMYNYKTQLKNVEWILQSVEAASKLGCKRFIGAGSITENEVFSQTGRIFLADKHRYYRVAQLACETIGRGLAGDLGIDFFWPRIINVYGPNEVAPRFINTFIRNLKKGISIPLSLGEQLYDFIYIDDAAEAFYLIADKGNSEKEYILGSGEVRPLRDYLLRIRDVVSPEIQLRLGELPYNGLFLSVEEMDIGNLKELGFKPQVSFDEGIMKVSECIEG